MPLTSMTAAHLGQAKGGFEPQRANNNLLYIEGLTTEEREILRMSLQSFPIPKVNIGVIEMNHLNEKKKFPGIPTWDDLSVVFNDFVDTATAATLWRWFRTVYDPKTGKLGLARVYKKTGRVVQLAPDGSTERAYGLEGVWISALDPGDSDMSSEDVLRITCTIVIDKATPEFDEYVDVYPATR